MLLNLHLMISRLMTLIFHPFKVQTAFLIFIGNFSNKALFHCIIAVNQVVSFSGLAEAGLISSKLSSGSLLSSSVENQGRFYFAAER